MTQQVGAASNARTELLASIQKEAKTAHVDTLSRIANLTVPTLATATPRTHLIAAIEQVRGHGETAAVFTGILSRLHQGPIQREDLDQRLLNWVLQVPGIKEKVGDLSPEMRTLAEEFAAHDLRQPFVLGQGINYPHNPATEEKMRQLGLALQAQVVKDGGQKFPSIVENTGERVWLMLKAQPLRIGRKRSRIRRSVEGVRNIVKYAKEVNKRVRVSGYRHSFTEIFSDEGEILISLLPLQIVASLPSIEGQFAPGAGLLQKIQLLPETETPDHASICVKIGTATTSEQFREWVLNPSGGASKWTLPLSVIIVETTFGGTISAMCHGAGINHPSLSDLVTEVEYVNANGEVRTVTDPALLRAAAGALGVVTAYTVRLDKMTYTSMRPRRVPVELAIPPPQEYIDAARAGDKRYEWIRELISPHGDEVIAKARAEFVHRAETDYYAEWFWFALQSDVWVNTWDNTGKESEAVNTPSDFEAFLEWLEEWLVEVITSWALWQLLPGDVQAKLLGFLTLALFPNVTENDPPIVTQLVNGLQFRRGIQNYRIYDMEWTLPVPANKSQPLTPLEPITGQDNVTAVPASPGPSRKTPTRDWTITEKAWWDCLLQMHEHPAVVRTAAEMRIVGGSNVILSPSGGHTFGSTAIEVVTNLDTPTREWAPFCQKLANKWLSYTDPVTKKRLKARPHWAKQWTFLTLPDESGSPVKASDWCRTVGYKEEIPAFLDDLKTIATDAGLTMDELRTRFGNRYLDSIFWGAKDEVVELRDPDGVVEKLVNRTRKWLRSCFTG